MAQRHLQESGKSKRNKTTSPSRRREQNAEDLAAAVEHNAQDAEGRMTSNAFLVGEMKPYAGTVAPDRWALCHGQLLSIEAEPALYAVIGVTWGGDNVTSFAAPDMRGRTLIGAGSGPGLTPRTVGQRSGLETHQLTEAELPEHNHTLQATATSATSIDPTGNMLATTASAIAGTTPDSIYEPLGLDDPVEMAPPSIGATGSGDAHNIMQPFSVGNYLIYLGAEA